VAAIVFSGRANRARDERAGGGGKGEGEERGEAGREGERGSSVRWQAQGMCMTARDRDREKGERKTELGRDKERQKTQRVTEGTLTLRDTDIYKESDIERSIGT
jgi:hypothetical protein